MKLTDNVHGMGKNMLIVANVSKRLLLVSMVAMLALSCPVDTMAQHRGGRPTVTTESAKAAKQRQKEKEKLQKQKEKARQEQLKQKVKQLKEQQKQKEKRRKEEAKLKAQAQKAKAKAPAKSTAKAPAKAPGKSPATSTAKPTNIVIRPVVPADTTAIVAASDTVTTKPNTADEKVLALKKALEKKSNEEEEPVVAQRQHRNTADETTRINREPMEWSAEHVISIGAGGGLASWLPQTNKANWPSARPANMGYDGLVDLTYTFYMNNQHKFGIGVHSGVAVGYTKSGQNVYLQEQQNIIDALGYDIDYTITSPEVKEQNSALMVEVPLMLALRYGGFFTNLGVKAMLPMLGHYEQTIAPVDVDAYYKALDVHVRNNTAAGLVADDELQKSGDWNAGKVNVMLAGELGYYIPLAEHFSLALSLYGDYSVYTTFKNTPQNQLFTVSGVGAGPTAATITATTLNNAFVVGNNFFDFGAKISFNVHL